MPSRQIFASPSRPLSEAQQRVLAALLDLCPGLGEEAELGPIAEAAGMKPSATTLALGGLRRRRFAAAEGSRPQVWTPTFAGREHARRLPSELFAGRPAAGEPRFRNEADAERSR